MQKTLWTGLAALALLGACGKPVGPVVEPAPAAVAAPSEAVQAEFLNRVKAALREGKPEALLALGHYDNASERARAMLPGLMKQQAEDCRHPGECTPSLAVSAKFAGMAMTAPAFGELVLERNDGQVITRAKFPVGLLDGRIVMVTEAR